MDMDAILVYQVDQSVEENVCWLDLPGAHTVDTDTDAVLVGQASSDISRVDHTDIDAVLEDSQRTSRVIM